MVLSGMMPAELISRVKWWRMTPWRWNLPAGVPSGVGRNGGAWGGHGRCEASSRGWPQVLGTCLLHRCVCQWSRYRTGACKCQAPCCAAGPMSWVAETCMHVSVSGTWACQHC